MRPGPLKCEPLQAPCHSGKGCFVYQAFVRADGTLFIAHACEHDRRSHYFVVSNALEGCIEAIRQACRESAWGRRSRLVLRSTEGDISVFSIPITGAYASLVFEGSHRVLSARADLQSVEILSDLKAKTQTTVIIGGRKITSEDADIYIARELAKDAWTSYYLHAGPFADIAQSWLESPEWVPIGSSSEVNALLAAAAQVGRSADLPLQTRQAASLAMFGHALSMIDAGASLYPRQISRRYLVGAFDQPPEERTMDDLIR